MGGEIDRVWPTAFAKASAHSFAIYGEELDIGKPGRAWAARHTIHRPSAWCGGMWNVDLERGSLCAL
jgi:hypothetical protein